MTDNEQESKDLEQQEETRRTKRAATSSGKERQAAAGRRNIVAFNESRGGRPALKHGIKALVESGEVPPVPGAKEAAERVDALLAEVVIDLGGPEAVTGGRKTILASQRLALLVLELAGQYLANQGLLNAKGEPHPLLHIVNSYANTARLNAISLGLERTQKNVTPTLDAALEQLAAKESAT